MAPKVLLSVIIPVYNTQNYLSQCLESIINQTFKEIQIICVNDGSTDNSLEILEKYAAADDRILVLNQQNNGISKARNHALEYSTGEYIAFIDSDDFISPDYLQVAYRNAIETGADCVINELYNYLPDENKTIHLKMRIQNDENVISGNEALLYSIDWSIHSLGIWKKDLFNTVKFDLRGAHGNEFTYHVLFAECKTVSFSKKGRYYYRQHLESISKKISVKTFDWPLKYSMMRELLMQKGIYDTVDISFERMYLTMLKQKHYLFFHVRRILTKEERLYSKKQLKDAYCTFNPHLIDKLDKNTSLSKRVYNKIIFTNYYLFYILSWILSKKIKYE